jgi:microcystin-dependent protein
MHPISVAQLAAHTHSLPSGNTGSTGGGAPIDIMEPSLVLNHAISIAGLVNASDQSPAVGEIRYFAGPIPASGYLPCDGRLTPPDFPLPQQIGMNLPDLRGRTGIYGTTGVKVGSETLAMDVSTLPAHTHLLGIQPQDFDGDNDVDADDMAAFLACSGRAFVPPLNPDCVKADFDHDNDVDPDDFAREQRCLCAPGIPPIPNCGG